MFVKWMGEYTYDQSNLINAYIFHMKKIPKKLKDLIKIMQLVRIWD